MEMAERIWGAPMRCLGDDGQQLSKLELLDETAFFWNHRKAGWRDET